MNFNNNSELVSGSPKFEVVENIIDGEVFRDIYEYKPDGYGGEAPDLISIEVKTPHCGFKEHWGAPSCTKMCDKKCPVAQNCMQELGIDF